MWATASNICGPPMESSMGFPGLYEINSEFLWIQIQPVPTFLENRLSFVF